jgi:hypothetical protein
VLDERTKNGLLAVHRERERERVYVRVFEVGGIVSRRVPIQSRERGTKKRRIEEETEPETNPVDSWQ